MAVNDKAKEEEEEASPSQELEQELEQEETSVAEPKRQVSHLLRLSL